MEKDYLDVVTLIRSIQRSEGDPDCFRRTSEDCGHQACEWQLY